MGSGAMKVSPWEVTLEHETARVMETGLADTMDMVLGELLALDWVNVLEVVWAPSSAVS